MNPGKEAVLRDVLSQSVNYWENPDYVDEFGGFSFDWGLNEEGEEDGEVYLEVEDVMGMIDNGVADQHQLSGSHDEINFLRYGAEVCLLRSKQLLLDHPLVKSLKSGYNLLMGRLSDLIIDTK